MRGERKGGGKEQGEAEPLQVTQICILEMTVGWSGIEADKFGKPDAGRVKGRAKWITDALWTGAVCLSSSATGQEQPAPMTMSPSDDPYWRDARGKAALEVGALSALAEHP